MSPNFHCVFLRGYLFQNNEHDQLVHPYLRTEHIRPITMQYMVTISRLIVGTTPPAMLSKFVAKLEIYTWISV